MIQSVITHECSKCRSLNIVKNGTDYKGGQKFHCLDCAAYGMLEPQSRSYPEFIREFVLRTYRERASMRGIERIFGIARQTLARWILEKAGAMPNLADTLETVKTDDVLELDELWSFVRTKNDKRWIWVALCRRTRQVVAYFIGDRSEKSCRALWKSIPASYKACCSFSDLARLPEGFTKRHSPKCRQRKRPDISRGTLEQHLAPETGSLRAQNSFFLQVRRLP